MSSVDAPCRLMEACQVRDSESKMMRGPHRQKMRKACGAVFSFLQNTSSTATKEICPHSPS